MTGISKRVEALFNKKRVEESPLFLSNGGALMEKLISLSNGRNEIHIKRFSIQEITNAFGVILLMLLTGSRLPFWWYGERMHLHEYVEKFVDVDDKLIDPKISEEVGMDEFQAIKYLALSGTESIPDYRPEMIDVARRLHEIKKQLKKSSCGIVCPFEDNQDEVLKKLMVLSNGRYNDIPFHIFSSEEVINGTNNFEEFLAGDNYYGIFNRSQSAVILGG